MIRSRAAALVVLGSLVLAVAGQSAAQVRYVDEQGNAHWAQSSDLVPEKYRAAATLPVLPSVTYKGAQGGAVVPGGGTSYSPSSSRGSSNAPARDSYSWTAPTQRAPSVQAPAQSRPSTFRSEERGTYNQRTGENPEGVGGPKYGSASH